MSKTYIDPAVKKKKRLKRTKKISIAICESEICTCSAYLERGPKFLFHEKPFQLNNRRNYFVFLEEYVYPVKKGYSFIHSFIFKCFLVNIY